MQACSVAIFTNEEVSKIVLSSSYGVLHTSPDSRQVDVMLVREAQSDYY